MKKSSGNEGSAYWNWASGRGDEGHSIEDREANPDSLSEEAAFIKKTPLTDEEEGQLSSYYRLINDGILQKLSEREREIWKLRFFHWNTEAEIADKLNLSLSTIKTLLSRAGLKLKVAILREQKRRELLHGHYFNDGFKKSVHVKGESKEDKEWGERLLKHQSEIETFCNMHEELKKNI